MIVRKVPSIDGDVFSYITQTEGVFGLEQYTHRGKSHYYVFSSPEYRFEGGEDASPLFPKHLKTDFVSLELEKPSFMPLFIGEEHRILQMHESIINMFPNAHLFFRIILMPVKDLWRTIAVEQYIEFLRGNESPSPSRMVRLVQGKMLEVIQKISGDEFKRNRVESVESKIKSTVYYTTCRAMIACNDKKTRKEIKHHLLHLYKSTAGLNQLKLIDIRKGLMNRKATKDQVLSLLELESLFLNGKQTVAKKEKVVSNTPLEKFIDLLPKGQEKEKEREEALSQAFLDAFTELKLGDHIEFKSQISSATTQKLTFKLGEGVKATTIKKAKEDIEAMVGINGLSILNGKEAKTLDFSVPLERRNIIYMKDIIQSQAFQQFIKKSTLPVCLGVDENGDLVLSDLKDLPHLLIAGTTGSGKSVFLVGLLLVLAMVKSPTDLHFYMIDPKRVELKKFKNYKHNQALVYEGEEGVHVVEALVEEMERRYELLEEHDVDDISEYNRLFPNKSLPYAVCVVEEYADLVMSEKKVENSIARLAQKARAAGIHLILATQRPSSDIVTGIIKSNIAAKIALLCESTTHYQTVFGTGQPYQLRGNGDGVAKIPGSTKEFIRFQAPLIHEDKLLVKETLKNIGDFIKGEKTPGIDWEKQRIEEPIEVVKRYIAKTGRATLDELQKESGIRRSEVQKIRNQLVEEGWLQKAPIRSKGYEVIATEEMLAEYKEKIISKEGVSHV